MVTVYHLPYLFCYTVAVNRKTFIIALVAIIVLAFLALWFFLRDDQTAETPVVVTDQPCLVFQSDDPSRPCFVSAQPSPVVIASATSTPECADGSVFEKNECVARVAEEQGDASLCSQIQGSLARSSCIQNVAEAKGPEAQAKPSAYEAFVRSVASSSQKASISSSSPAFVETVRNISEAVLSVEETAKVSPEGLYERLATKADLVAYNVSPYQSRPGDMVKVQGAGFALDATNVVSVGGVTVSGLKSADGITLSFAVPSSASSGTHEVWVTNARGSTRSSERPLYMVVSQTPVAPPKITGFSPAQPKYTDTITLSGTNLNGIKAVSTTLGIIQGSSLSFKVSSLEYAHLVLDQESLKGTIIPLYVYVQAEGGISEEPFIIDVQF